MKKDGAGPPRVRGRPFKPGESGNLNGRPRKREVAAAPDRLRLAEVAAAHAAQIVKGSKNGKVVDVTLHEAVLNALAKGAIQDGNHRASAELLKIYNEGLRVLEAERARKQEEFDELFAFYMDQQAQHPELRLSQKVAPHLGFNPFDVAFCHGRLVGWINGPRTEEEAAVWRKMEERKKGQHRELGLFRKEKSQKMIARDMAQCEHIIELLDTCFPSVAVRRAPGYNLDVARAEWFRKDAVRKRKKERERRAAARPTAQVAA